MVVVKRAANPDYGSEIDDGEKVDIPANNARGAVTDHNVRNVLTVSIMAVVVLFGLIYLFFFAG